MRALLMDILRCAPTSNRPMSPVELDGRDLGQVEIRREWCNIDLLIVSESPRLVVAIENKIDSTEHSEQLDRYHDTVASSFANWPKLFVYLTTEGGAPSHEQWMSYSYGDIHRVLSRVRRTHKDSIGNDVAIFVDHYL
ncbi:PD-(D/E)XK nuclease family protein, partial [bacterium]|nr:PD-(D/E)XK nuclease family protein [bacterium]